MNMVNNEMNMVIQNFTQKELILVFWCIIVTINREQVLQVNINKYNNKYIQEMKLLKIK